MDKGKVETVPMVYHCGFPEIARVPNEMKVLHSWDRTEVTAASAYKADDVEGGFENNVENRKFEALGSQRFEKIYNLQLISME